MSRKVGLLGGLVDPLASIYEESPAGVVIFIPRFVKMCTFKTTRLILNILMNDLPLNSRQ